MRIKIVTVIDITLIQSRQRDKFKNNQMANYNTLLHTAMLRTNIDPIDCQSYVSDVSDLGFGENITGKQRYWIFTFDSDYFGEELIEMLVDDFDLVPVILDLNDTATINNSAFRTKDKKEKNIIFIKENE